MLDRRDAGLEEHRKGVIQEMRERRDSGGEEFRKRFQDWKDTGEEGYRRGGI